MLNGQLCSFSWVTKWNNAITIFMQNYDNKWKWYENQKFQNLNSCLSQSGELGKGMPYWLSPIFVQACPCAYT